MGGDGKRGAQNSEEGVMGAQRRSQGAPSLEYLSRGAPEVSRVPVEYLTGSHHPLLLLHLHLLGAETGGRQREGSLDVGGRVDLDSWARLHGGGGEVCSKETARYGGREWFVTQGLPHLCSTHKGEVNPRVT